MMSGFTPYCSIPNHLPPVRPQPVCTSSAMKTPSARFTMSATIGQYSQGGVMKPPTPRMGSPMKAAGRPEVVVLMTSSTSCAQAVPQVSGLSFSGQR